MTTLKAAGRGIYKITSVIQDLVFLPKHYESKKLSGIFTGLNRPIGDSFGGVFESFKYISKLIMPRVLRQKRILALIILDY